MPIRIFSALTDHKAQLGGVASGSYIVAPESAKPELVKSLTEIAFLETSFSWAAALEVAAGVYLFILIGAYAIKGVKWLGERFGR